LRPFWNWKAPDAKLFVRVRGAGPGELVLMSEDGASQTQSVDCVAAKWQWRTVSITGRITRSGRYSRFQCRTGTIDLDTSIWRRAGADLTAAGRGRSGAAVFPCRLYGFNSATALFCARV